MADVKWIRIVTDIFDNRKIKQIETMPEGDTIIVIWLKLLCLAGVVNDNGYIYFTEDIPYTDQLLANQFCRPLATIQLALHTFQSFGMIEIIDDVICVANWERYQNIEGMEKIKEQTRLRVAKYRERKKLGCNVTGNVTVTQGNEIDIDIDIESEREKEKDIKSVSDKSDTLSVRTDIERIVAMWNELDGIGDIKGIRGIGERGDRKRLTTARLKEYGLDGFRNAIDRIKASDFLQGKHNGNPWVITYDWLIKPNNFPKVLEGNYDNKECGSQNGKDWWK